MNGRDYRDAAAPTAEFGIMLEARAVHTGRSEGTVKVHVGRILAKLDLRDRV